MKTFFKRLRFFAFEKHKVQKYFLYAVLEVTLITLGVFLGFALESWKDASTGYRDLMHNIILKEHHVEEKLDSLNITISENKNLIQFTQNYLNGDLNIKSDEEKADAVYKLMSYSKYEAKDIEIIFTDFNIYVDLDPYNNLKDDMLQSKGMEINSRLIELRYAANSIIEIKDNYLSPLLIEQRLASMYWAYSKDLPSRSAELSKIYDNEVFKEIVALKLEKHEDYYYSLNNLSQAMSGYISYTKKAFDELRYFYNNNLPLVKPM